MLVQYSVGHFQVSSYRCRSLIEGLYTVLEAFYTLNSPPVVSVNIGSRNGGGLRFQEKAWFGPREPDTPSLRNRA